MKTRLLISLCFVFCMSNLFAQGTLDSGLVRSYPFNGNAYDRSGNNDTGVIFGATLTPDRFNTANSAYRFDGINDHIDFDGNGFNFQEFSFSIWVNIEYDSSKTNGVGVYALMYVGNSISNDHGISTGGNADQWTVGSYHTTGGLVNILSGVQPTTSTWHHLVFTRDVDSVKLYLNGNHIGSNTVGGKAPGWQDSLLGVIGARPAYSFYFQGALDDVRIYARSITQAEVTSLYNHNPSGFQSLQSIRHTLYPNPIASGQILRFDVMDEFFADSKFSLYSSTGQLVHNVPFSGTVEIPQLADGIYYVVVQGSESILKEKLVIKN